MTHEMTASLSPSEILKRAKTFFAERVPQYGAFLEKEGPGYACFRGQGGEEIVLAVFTDSRGARVRASSMLYAQVIGRFFSTLPAAEEA